MRLEHLLSGGTQGERQEIARGSHLKRSVASPGFLYAAVCLIIGNEGSRAFVAPRLGSATGRDESFWGRDSVLSAPREKRDEPFDILE